MILQQGGPHYIVDGAMGPLYHGNTLRVVGRAVVYLTSNHCLQLGPDVAHKLGTSITQHGSWDSKIGDQVAVESLGYGSSGVVGHWYQDDLFGKHVNHRHHEPFSHGEVQMAP